MTKEELISKKQSAEFNNNFFYYVKLSDALSVIDRLMIENSDLREGREGREGRDKIIFDGKYRVGFKVKEGKEFHFMGVKYFLSSTICNLIEDQRNTISIRSKNIEDLEKKIEFLEKNIDVDFIKKYNKLCDDNDKLKKDNEGLCDKITTLNVQLILKDGKIRLLDSFNNVKLENEDKYKSEIKRLKKKVNKLIKKI